MEGRRTKGKVVVKCTAVLFDLNMALCLYECGRAGQLQLQLQLSEA
jgi:hypothetical protein